MADERRAHAGWKKAFRLPKPDDAIAYGTASSIGGQREPVRADQAAYVKNVGDLTSEDSKVGHSRWSESDDEPVATSSALPASDTPQWVTEPDA